MEVLVITEFQEKKFLSAFRSRFDEAGLSGIGVRTIKIKYRPRPNISVPRHSFVILFLPGDIRNPFLVNKDLILHCYDRAVALIIVLRCFTPDFLRIRSDFLSQAKDIESRRPNLICFSSARKDLTDLQFSCVKSFIEHYGSIPHPSESETCVTFRDDMVSKFFPDFK